MAAEIVPAIARFAIFSDLSTPELEGIAHLFEEAFYPAGERVLRQGLSGSGFYIILEGEAAIHVDGVERSRLRSGDHFGEVSCLLGEKPVADIVAVGPLRCLVLPGPRLESFLLSHPRVMFRLLQAEARRVQTTTRWLS